MFSVTWPVTLRRDLGDGRLFVLRALTRHDKTAYEKLKFRNREWLKEWEATSPYMVGELPFATYRKIINREAKAGKMLPFVIEANGTILGQVTVANIQYGSAYSANVGYWIGEEYAGHGYVPLAVAMVTDYCFQELGLHRMEIHIRPENEKSLRVARKLGFREEGFRRGYLHINGEWADHVSFALCDDEVEDSLVETLQ